MRFSILPSALRLSLAVATLPFTNALVLRNTENSNQIRPYTVNVDPSFVEETRLKAASFRPSTDIDQPAWTDGPPTSNVTSIAQYWAEEYDWSAIQAQINQNFSHYITTITPSAGNFSDPLDIHFIHQRSERPDAIPLLMVHGWPSTSLEWEKVILDLVDPVDDATPAFHVVAPDLPGYGFSPAPKRPGLGLLEHASVLADLMERLAYDRYAVYSTDLGFIVSLRIMEEYESRIINHISDMFLVVPTDDDLERYTKNETTAEETAYITSMNTFVNDHSAYSNVHSTFPLAIAHSLDDSPVGFLAWMWHLVYTASDQAYTASELITEAFLLYIPGVYGNIRSYKELYSLTNFAPKRNTSVPTSVLQFGGLNGYPSLGSFNFVPRDWYQRVANVTYFARHDRGGHFPALSAPDLVLDDIRAIFA